MALLSDEQLYTTSGLRKTRSLFKEFCRPEDTPCLSVSRQEKDGLIQLAPIYLELVEADPSEYAFAEHVFGSYAHWKLIAEAAWMQPHIEEWRMEADVRRKSLAFRAMHNDVLLGTRTSITSAKYLIEEPWKGRAKKVQEKSKATTEKAAEGFKDDFLRLREHMK